MMQEKWKASHFLGQGMGRYECYCSEIVFSLITYRKCCHGLEILIYLIYLYTSILHAQFCYMQFVCMYDSALLDKLLN